jgi:hypothetical protein
MGSDKQIEGVFKGETSSTPKLMMNELRQLKIEMANLIANLSPFIGMDEMEARYDCTGQTLRKMERRGEIPFRIKGRWLRIDVIEYEKKN